MHVIESGVLHLYPDVSDRNTNAVERLREGFQSVGVDASKLDDAALREMLKRVSPEQEFVVRVSDIKAGQALSRGKAEPLTEQQAKRQNSKRDTARHNDEQRRGSSSR